MSKKSENNTSRLASLDILRGFDLFLLVFFQPVFAALVRQLNLPFLNDILYQFDHEVWEGFRFWDLVMPLFLFMTGASMPFSLSKYIGTSGSYRPVYRRILKRGISAVCFWDWMASIFISIQTLCSLLLSAILLRQSSSCIFRSSGR
mgnify:CR=1 FL=1